MKKIILTGNLTKDVELRQIKSGDKDIDVATLAIAVNEIGSDGATYFDVDVWRGLAALCAKNLSKGSKVSVLADIKANNYEKDGKKVYGYKFIADEVEFLSPKKSEE